VTLTIFIGGFPALTVGEGGGRHERLWRSEGEEVVGQLS